MSTTLKTPIEVNPYGKISIVVGVEEVRQFIRNMFKPRNSRNPWDIKERIGISENVVFSMNNSYIKNDIKDILKEKFLPLETKKVAKLLPHTVAITQENGNATVSLSYYIYEEARVQTDKIAIGS
jgi:hypothetical protein